MMFDVQFTINESEIYSIIDLNENEIDSTVDLNDNELNTNPDFEKNIVATGTRDHNELYNRKAENSHPIAAITGLQEELDDKIRSSNVLTNKEIEGLLK